MIANIDANGWVIIIAAIFFGMGQMTQIIISYLRERDRLVRETKLATKVDKVEKSTDGMLEEIRRAEFAKGVKSETDKQ